ncbi:hypothetical protein [Psittacicella hinzii]|uniref:hypothetical protein n=1 Tax=Psittacicella hinzii TaxID=2028575 RepID=UPI001CA64674|nr:hypothetical protein [Psittacicella hinzii]
MNKFDANDLGAPEVNPKARKPRNFDFAQPQVDHHVDPLRKPRWWRRICWWLN